MNTIYHNRTNKTQPPKEKISTTPILLESPKNKGFQSPELEVDFLLDSGAESNIIKYKLYTRNCYLQRHPAN